MGDSKVTVAVEVKVPDIKQVETKLIADAKQLVEQVLGERGTKTVNTAMEAIAMVCIVVEKTSQLRHNKDKVRGAIKAELAIDIADYVVDQLYKRSVPLITKDTYDKSKQLISNTQLLGEVIAGCIAIANAAGLIQTAKEELTACASLFSCCKQ
ncbi:Hypothetical protein POVN_LOCUS23 [uncultured virus]|nr:Hypothetical protein POVN_LOCUS23 [uncultured virus]